MKTSKFIGLFCAVLFVPALAIGAEQSADLLSQGEPSISPDETVTTGDPCDAVSDYQPAPDVADQAGVDVDGNPVTPADLDDGPRSLFGANYEHNVALVLPLKDATDAGPGTGAERVADSDVSVGQVAVRDGKVYFGDQLIGDQGAQALAQACAMRKAKSSN